MKIDWQRKVAERGMRTEPLWTLHELADFVGVSHGTLRNALSEEGAPKPALKPKHTGPSSITRYRYEKGPFLKWWKGRT